MLDDKNSEKTTIALLFQIFISSNKIVDYYVVVYFGVGKKS